MLYLTVAAGFAILLGGGEILVRGSVAVAERVGVSPLVIGLTLVGFGTSMPELVASLKAALAGSPSLAMGNIVGSNIANILLILGVGAVLSPFATDPRAFRRDGPVLIAVSGLLVLACLVGSVGRWSGLGLLTFLLLYTVWTYISERRATDPSAAPHAGGVSLVGSHPWGLIVALGMTVLGIAGVVVGADLLVTGAIELARRFGVPEALVGLTLVAVGTSLPELATTIAAARKGATGVAFGNAVGSCIFNGLGILGTTAVVAPLTIPGAIASSDIFVMFGSAVLGMLFAVSGWRLSRLEGGVLLLSYAGYIVWLLW